MASNPLSPGAFHDFAAKILCYTSSIVRGAMATAVRCGRGPLSSILVGSREKNTDSSSSTCSVLSLWWIRPFLLAVVSCQMQRCHWDPGTLFFARYKSFF